METEGDRDKKQKEIDERWFRERYNAEAMGFPTNDAELEFLRGQLPTLRDATQQKLDKYALTANAGGLVISLQVAITSATQPFSWIEKLHTTTTIIVFCLGVFLSGMSLLASTSILGEKAYIMSISRSAMEAYNLALSSERLTKLRATEEKLQRYALYACGLGILLGTHGVIMRLWF